MRKAIKEYLAKLQENDKKGFSLVELIIVMAIMAVLVGVVASQVLPYLEKSRLSKDQENLASLQMDINTAIATAANDITYDKTVAIADLDTICSGAADELKELRGGTMPSFTGLKFKSKKAKTGKDIYISVASNGELTVFISSAADANTAKTSGAVDPKLSVSSSNTSTSSTAAPATT